MRSVSAGDGALPDFDGNDAPKVRIEVLGLVADLSTGKPLLSGDLNIPAENHLLVAHTGLGA